MKYDGIWQKVVESCQRWSIVHLSLGNRILKISILSVKQ